MDTEHKPDNDLIKALRCLASQKDNGDCYMDLYNNENPDKQPIGCGRYAPETAPCPYYQAKYCTAFGEAEYSEWLNAVADMMDIFGVNTEHSGGVESSRGKEQK